MRLSRALLASSLLLAFAAVVCSVYTDESTISACTITSGTLFPKLYSYISTRNTNFTATGTPITVVVYYVAWTDTAEEKKFRIKYNTPRTPNFFPAGLAGTYGPKLPDPRVNPIERASRFFQQMTFGKVSFNATYRRVQMLEPLGLGTSAPECPVAFLTDAVLTYIDTYEQSKYKPGVFDLAILVFPDSDAQIATSPATWTSQFPASNAGFVKYGYNLLSFRTYQSFRHDDSITTTAKNLFQSLGSLFGIGRGDYWDLNYTRGPSPGEDRSDFTGYAGAQTLAFTNPANLQRMGVLDDVVDIRPISRDGIYRIWPLYLNALDKNWSYPGFLDLSASATYTTPKIWQRYRSINFAPSYVVAANGSVQVGQFSSLLWHRDGITYKANEQNSSLRAKFHFSNSLLVHQYDSTKANLNTGWTQKNSYTTLPSEEYMLNNARYVVGSSIESVLATCNYEVLCRDTSTNPPSFLVQTVCNYAYSDVITEVLSASGDRYLRTPFTATVDVTLNLNRVQKTAVTNDTLGFLSIAYTGTKCTGATLRKVMIIGPPDTYGTNGNDTYIVTIPATWYTTFESNRPLSICYAEYDTYGGSDFLFVEQTGMTLEILDNYYSVDSNCYGTNQLGSACVSTTAYYEYPTLPGVYPSSGRGSQLQCVTSSSTTSYTNANASRILYSGRYVCCMSRGYISQFNITKVGTVTVGASCTCDDNAQFSGTFCGTLVGSALTLTSRFPASKFVKSSFRVYAKIAEYSTNNYTADCYVKFSDDSTVSVGSLFFRGTTLTSFSQGTNVPQLTQYITIPNDVAKYAPWILVYCNATNSAHEFYSNPVSVLNVTVNPLPALEAPTFLRVKGYGQNGNVTVAWDVYTYYTSYSDLTYTVSYQVYNSSSDVGSLDSISGIYANATSIELPNLKIGLAYRVYISSVSTGSGTLDSGDLWVVPMQFNSTCVDSGGDTNPKYCNNSNCDATYGYCSPALDCWCKGWYHGQDCATSGCYKDATDALNNKVCSGHGTCSGTGATQNCSCDAGYFGFWCHRFDWLNPPFVWVFPQNESVVLTDASMVTLQLKHPVTDAVSTGSFWVQYGGSGKTSSDLTYDGWSKLSDVTSDSSGLISHQFFLDPIITGGQPNGVVGIQYRDSYYTNLASTNYATINHDTAAPTYAPSSAPTVAVIVTPAPPSDNSLASLLWKGNNKIYTIVGAVVIILGVTAGIAIFLVGKARRKMLGQHVLDDVNAGEAGTAKTGTAI
jgi:hypothetical protein